MSKASTVPGRRLERSQLLRAVLNLRTANAALPGAVAIADHTRVNRFLKSFGIVLLLSGLAHSAGVAHFYMTGGVPGANRVLLDSVIAHAGELVQPIGVDAPEITARFRDPPGNVIGLYQQPSPPA